MLKLRSIIDVSDTNLMNYIKTDKDFVMNYINDLKNDRNYVNNTNGNKKMVKDMVIGKNYYFNNNKYIGKLIDKYISGYGGSGYQEPYYKLVFGNCTITEDWDTLFIEE